MTRNQQVSGTESPEVGALLTKPRRYNLTTDLLLFGRANSLRRDLARASGARPGDQVIDIGCGPGKLARVLAEQVGAQGRVLGIDPSEPMVEYATAHSPKNCSFELGAAQSLAQPDASFDVVTSTFAMHHIPEAERDTALAAMFRVLRPGGRLLLADIRPAHGVHGFVMRTMAHVSAHRHGGHEHGTGHDPLAEVDIRRYRDSLQRIGFTDIEFTELPFSVGVLTATKPQ
ncbi:methyltransferase domain-containing protein [Nocardia sp. NPDC051030]|uniref:class I SAM-dependent methyltransferase n=1 Tax=Nocardia sp. NPDC051030 TaxID=3155162 RepID=UPI003423FDBC